MLKHTLLHPAILAAIARAGHHGRIVIADGNYPASTTLGPSAELVSLNLMPGVVDACQVLESILSAVPIDFAYVMDYERTGPYALTEDPPAWHDFRRILKQHRPGVNQAECLACHKPLDKVSYTFTLKELTTVAKK